MFEIVCICFALTFGWFSLRIGFPPLVGFLAAGFVLNLSSDAIGLPDSTQGTLQHIAHLGILMLLFSVGLKINVRQIIKPEVVGGALVHFAISVALFLGISVGVMGLDPGASFFVAICLSFSSTVLAAKLLETKGELGSFHGRTSIGILIIQDLIAILVLSIWGGQAPNIYALALLTLPLLRILIHKMVDRTGHGELFILLSLLLSVVVGGYGFTAMGLSSELGALVIGALLADHKRRSELSVALSSMKELFVVCFFLSIGMANLPSLRDLWFALIFLVALPVKAVLFYFILIAFRLRGRTSYLGAVSLTSYSEFGLIVAAVVLPEYTVALSLCLAFSYLLAAPVNRYAHRIFERYEHRLSHFSRKEFHPDEQPQDLEGHDVLVFGMGRVGAGAFNCLLEQGYKPIGLDSDVYTVKKRTESGMRTFFADAEDSQFWAGIDLDNIDAAILAMDCIEAKLISARMLKKAGFKGPIISHALHDDHKDRIIEAGASKAYLTMTQAGIGLAESAIQSLPARAPA